MNKTLECRKLVKTYVDGARTLEILRGVDLSVYDGEIVAISGSSGAGKSTLLHLIGTLDRPTSGEILFRDQPLSRLSRGAINKIRNKEIGFVFQFYHLLPEFTAMENVMMPALCQGARRSACRPRAEELLEKVGLADRMTHKPGRLSGGEQQRVAIARALFNKPGVVLADEPTGNLDERTGEGITELLWKLNETDRITLLIVTHDEHLAGRAHRWIHLHEGLAHVKKAGLEG
ncbi:MAG TPA: ABC transporter ATP-binding protein [Candidatus Hydrogenedentes bacterium]|nr:ABC transporter ATP-binding protein [Candidatus Hydrogenedentota bacterium]HPC16436.1 ABC transporter ATP-binding protein [Candidatus Hydrogenedentota bacterium]HRT20369.1 ABC transporter ATP-binding protein [Candidatus Hydrogenedentota bacterium]HRT65095.1 ABC transporter ATP-binding protein [Candidatus Hydrogenedentota bacterium]